MKEGHGTWRCQRGQTSAAMTITTTATAIATPPASVTKSSWRCGSREGTVRTGLDRVGRGVPARAAYSKGDGGGGDGGDGSEHVVDHEGQVRVPRLPLGAVQAFGQHGQRERHHQRARALEDPGDGRVTGVSVVLARARDESEEAQRTHRDGGHDARRGALKVDRCGVQRRRVDVAVGKPTWVGRGKERWRGSDESGKGTSMGKTRGPGSEKSGKGKGMPALPIRVWRGWMTTYIGRAHAVAMTLTQAKRRSRLTVTGVSGRFDRRRMWVTITASVSARFQMACRGQDGREGRQRRRRAR